MMKIKMIDTIKERDPIGVAMVVLVSELKEVEET